MTTLSLAVLAFVVFISKHAAALLLVLLVATAAGTAVAGARMPASLRAALCLGVLCEGLIVLGTFGALGPVGICLFVSLLLVLGSALAGGDWRPKIFWTHLAVIDAAVLPVLS